MVAGDEGLEAGACRMHEGARGGSDDDDNDFGDSEDDVDGEEEEEDEEEEGSEEGGVSEEVVSNTVGLSAFQPSAASGPQQRGQRAVTGPLRCTAASRQQQPQPRRHAGPSAADEGLADVEAGGGVAAMEEEACAAAAAVIGGPSHKRQRSASPEREEGRPAHGAPLQCA